MANQNLSQFGENTSVSDADYTFVWDSAASISKKVSRNSWLSAGSIATSTPLTISQTWTDAAVAFAAMKIVATDTNSAAGSDFLELYSGTATQPLRLDIQKTGQLNIYGTWSNSTSYERLSFIAPTAANAIIGTNKGSGGGTARGLDLHTDGSARMTITTAGNVGIGTTNPITAAGSTLLTISHAGVPGIYWQNTSAVANSRNWNFLVNGLNFEFQSVNDAISSSTVALKFNRNSGLTTIDSVEIPSSRLIVGGTGNTTIAGNVGIGTTSPTSKLQVTNGDVEIETVTSGIIMKAAGTSTRYRITLNAGGTALVFTAI